MAHEIWLGADPGTAHFAVTVIRYCTETRRKKVLYVGMIENPIKNLTETAVTMKRRKKKNGVAQPHIDKDEPRLSIAVKLFTDEIDWLLTTYKVTHFVGERFQARGRMMGDTIEAVSTMMGIIIAMCQRRRIKFLTTIAGVWKGAIARQRCDLPKLYANGIIIYQKALAEAGFKATQGEASDIVHMIDSSLIALWHADREQVWANSSLLRVLTERLLRQASAGESSSERLNES
jgi:hypothetical protein